jgi:hypothetical protein
VVVLVGFVLLPNCCEFIADFSSCDASGKRHFGLVEEVGHPPIDPIRRDNVGVIGEE